MLLKRILSIIKLFCYKYIFRKHLYFHIKSIIFPSIKIRCSSHEKIVFGKEVCIRDNVLFNLSNRGKIIIENKVFINDGCKINCRESIIIGEGSLLGQDVLIYDHDHDYKKGPTEKSNSFIVKKVYIGRNVWIGSGCIILKGVNIGDNSVIAAGSLITHDVPSNSLVHNKRLLYQKEISYEKI